MKGRGILWVGLLTGLFLFICWVWWDTYHPKTEQQEAIEKSGYPEGMYSQCRTVGQQFLGNETERMETWTNARWYDGCHPTYDGGFRLYLIKNGSNELLMVGEEKAVELMFLDHSIRVHHFIVTVECC